MLKERKLISMDWAMKRLLRNKANYEILEGFLSELFGFDIKIKNILESEGNQESLEDKFNRVDIVAETKEGKVVIVELQVSFEADYFHRMLYGTSKAIVERMDLGKAYENVVKVFSVNIVYFDLGQGEDYVYHGTTIFKGLNKGDTLQLSKRQLKALEYKYGKIEDIFPEYYILRVNGFNDVAKSSLDEWIYYFKHDEILDSFKAKGLSKAKELLRTDKMSPEELAAYKRHIENVRLALSLLDSAKKEGKIEGRAEGEKIGLEKGRAEGEKIGLEKGRAEGEKIGLEKGRAEGEKIGLYKAALSLMRKGTTEKDASLILNLPLNVVKKLSGVLKKYSDKAESHLDEI